MKEYTEYLIQGILYLFSDTLKYTLYLLGRIISNLPDLMNHTVAVDIAKRWGKRIIEEGSMNVLKGEDILRGEVIDYMRSRQRTDKRCGISSYSDSFYSNETGVPNNLLAEPSSSSPGGSHDHSGRGGTKPSLCE